MALNIDLFYSCSVFERADFVSRRGEYITTVYYKGYFISLYIVQETFVEVYTNPFTELIEDVETMDHDNERLNLFANQVDLADLFRIEY